MTIPDKSPHLAEYGAEFLGTAFMVFVGLSAVVFNLSPDLPMSHWIPDLSQRRLITGIWFAGTGALVAISPLGRLSGGHINPSVSLAFWLAGKMRVKDFLCYVVAQMLGGIFGASVLAIAWRGYATSVQYGMTLPGKGWPIGEVFLAEVFITCVLVLMIFIFVSRRRLMRWTPLMTWLLIAVMVWLEAAISGTSLNFARSFGPALIAWNWNYLWIYAFAPALGGVLGMVIFDLMTKTGRDLLTGKLFLAANYRNLFKGEVKPPR